MHQENLRPNVQTGSGVRSARCSPRLSRSGARPSAAGSGAAGRPGNRPRARARTSRGTFATASPRRCSRAGTPAAAGDRRDWAQRGVCAPVCFCFAPLCRVSNREAAAKLLSRADSLCLGCKRLGHVELATRCCDWNIFVCGLCLQGACGV